MHTAGESRPLGLMGFGMTTGSEPAQRGFFPLNSISMGDFLGGPAQILPVCWNTRRGNTFGTAFTAYAASG